MIYEKNDGFLRKQPLLTGAIGAGDATIIGKTVVPSLLKFIPAGVPVEEG